MKNALLSKTVVLSAALLIGSLSSASADQTNRWNMCEWQNIPAHVVQRIVHRADYDDILRQMFNACPDSALSLTDRPTASITRNQNSVGDRSRSSDSGGWFGGNGGRGDGGGSNSGGGNGGGGGGEAPGNSDGPSESPGSLPG